jgi:hypothetical protein
VFIVAAGTTAPTTYDYGYARTAPAAYDTTKTYYQQAAPATQAYSADYQGWFLFFRHAILLYLKTTIIELRLYNFTKIFHFSHFFFCIVGKPNVLFIKFFCLFYSIAMCL